MGILAQAFSPIGGFHREIHIDKSDDWYFRFDDNLPNNTNKLFVSVSSRNWECFRQFKLGENVHDTHGDDGNCLSENIKCI